MAIVIDICDLDTGEVKQVRARGVAELHPFDRERAYRKLSRYLGSDERRWDANRFTLEDAATTKFVKLTPDRIDALNLSFCPSARGQ